MWTVRRGFWIVLLAFPLIFRTVVVEARDIKSPKVASEAHIVSPDTEDSIHQVQQQLMKSDNTIHEESGVDGGSGKESIPNTLYGNEGDVIVAIAEDVLEGRGGVDIRFEPNGKYVVDEGSDEDDAIAELELKRDNTKDNQHHVYNGVKDIDDESIELPVYAKIESINDPLQETVVQKNQGNTQSTIEEVAEFVPDNDKGRELREGDDSNDGQENDRKNSNEEKNDNDGQERYLGSILPEHISFVSTSGVTSVDAFGAIPDGKTLNTDAINLAIGAVSESGGGTVLFPGPGTYMSSTIFLRDNVRVLVSEGATVMATKDPKLWPTIRHMFGVLMCGGQMGRYYKRRFVGGPLFFCHLCNNVTLTGKGGVVDGQGAHWWDRNQGKGLFRGYLAMFINATNIDVTDLTFQNSAAWNIVPKYCTNVTIDRVNIYNHYVLGRNTDGINPYSSKNVSITNSVIVTGDDCIAVKSGPRPSCGIPSEDIFVNNVTCVGSHGLTIGSEMNAGVRNVVFANVTIDGRNTPSSQGIRLKSVRGRGGFVRNILYENIRIHNVKIGIQITLNYREVDPSIVPVPHFGNITIRNVYGTMIHREIGTFDGLPDSPIDGINLENVFLFASAKATRLQCTETINARFSRVFPPPDIAGSCVQDKMEMIMEALGCSDGLFSWPRWLSARTMFWLW